jgi:dihydrofolate reductase
MTISIIYARSLNHCIGNEEGLPWDLPCEFAHFNRTTMGHSVIMGRRSYEDHRSELPGRLNIVVSKQQNYPLVPNVKLAHSVERAIELGLKYNQEVFIIGGTELIVNALPMRETTTVYESIIDVNCEGDTFLPEFNFDSWQSTLISKHAVDQNHRFSFEVWRRTRLSQA